MIMMVIVTDIDDLLRPLMIIMRITILVTIHVVVPWSPLTMMVGVLLLMIVVPECPPDLAIFT